MGSAGSVDTLERPKGDWLRLLCGMSFWRSHHKCRACGMCEEEPFLPLANTLWHFFKEQMLIYG